MPDFVEQLHARLLELGCPAGRLRRAIREVADHREDLMQGALAEGLTGPAAAAQAEVRLGNPQDLAEDLMNSWRRSSWYWRHTYLTLGLLPLLLFPVLWLLILFLGLAIGFMVFFGWDQQALQMAANDPATFARMVRSLKFVDHAAIAFVVYLFCLVARWSAAGLKSMLLAGSICTGYAMFTYAWLIPHNFTIGATWQPQWIRAALPLVIVGLTYWNGRRQVRRALQQAV